MSTYQTTQPFIYTIGWTDLNAWYLGIRYARGCQPIDLWTTYFTSSKSVAELRETYGEPDSFVILATGTADEVREWEHSLIIDLALHRGGRWLNRGAYKVFNGQMTPEIRSKISATMKAQRTTETARQELSERSTRYWSNPANREKRSRDYQAKFSDPGYNDQVKAKRDRTRADRKLAGKDYSFNATRPRGTNHANSVLTEQNVRDIRSSTEPTKLVSATFGVSGVTINNIRAGRTWKHLL